MTSEEGRTAAQRLDDFAGTLALIGAGNMGGAMLKGWLELGLDPAKVIVQEPQPSLLIAGLEKRGLRVNPKRGLISPATVIVLAVKPQVAADIVPDLGQLVGPATLVVSIMAGKTLRFLASGLPPDTAVVRAMPNTPAAIGRGMTVAVSNGRETEAQRTVAHALLAATGAIEWVDDEALLDAVTAVSGSGPAYVFLLAEYLARAGVAAGLPEDLALRLARETVAGSGELLHRSTLDPATLRQNVTSPGGTTEAALSVLMGPDGLAPLMEKAIQTATQRSRQLAG